MKVTGPVNGLDMVRHSKPRPKELLLRVECPFIILLQKLDLAGGLIVHSCICMFGLHNPSWG